MTRPSFSTRVSRMAAELKVLRARVAEMEGAYETLSGLLRARFPANPDGSLPDYRVEDVFARAEVAEARVAKLEAMEAEVDRLHSELASARTVERKDLYEQIERLTRLASCLASAVKCGESWTDTLEREYRAALAQPAATGEG